VGWHGPHDLFECAPRVRVETLLPNVRVVLAILASRVPFDGLTRLALVEDEGIEGGPVRFANCSVLGGRPADWRRPESSLQPRFLGVVAEGRDDHGGDGNDAGFMVAGAIASVSAMLPAPSGAD